MKRDTQKDVVEPNFPRQFVINWLKYHLKENNGGKKNGTQITTQAVDEVVERIKMLFESIASHHQDYQVKLPNRRGQSIFEEDIVDFFNTYFLS